MRTAIVEPNNVVSHVWVTSPENVSLLDGQQAIACDETVGVGSTYDGQTFSPPRKADDAVRREIRDECHSRIVAEMSYSDQRRAADMAATNRLPSPQDANFIEWSDWNTAMVAAARTMQDTDPPAETAWPAVPQGVKDLADWLNQRPSGQQRQR